MIEAINTSSFGAFGVPNNFFVHPYSATKPTTYVPAFKQTDFQNAPTFCSDRFIRTINVGNKKLNPVLGALESFAIRFAPKLYIDRFMNEKSLKRAVAMNPQIANILATKGLGVKIEVANATGKTQEHFLRTYAETKKLGKQLPKEEYATLMQAALLHDIGKAFIPREILDKPAALTPEERGIVDLHAKIGAEVLKTFNMQPKTIEAVRLHHTGCLDPAKQDNTVAQILSVADVYTALKEERPYKKPFSNEQVKSIMQGDPKLNQEIVSELISFEKL